MRGTDDTDGGDKAAEERSRKDNVEEAKTEQAKDTCDHANLRWHLSTIAT